MYIFHLSNVVNNLSSSHKDLSVPVSLGVPRICSFISGKIIAGGRCRNNDTCDENSSIIFCTVTYLLRPFSSDNLYWFLCSCTSFKYSIHCARTVVVESEICAGGVSPLSSIYK